MDLKNKRIVLIAAAALLLALAGGGLFVSCGAAAEAFGGFGGRQSDKMVSGAPEAPMETAKEEMPEEFAANEAESATGAAVSADTGSALPREEVRKRVYTGYAELLVDNVEKEKRAVTDIANNSGGYVENILENTITIRIPADKFSVLFADIRKLGDLLDSYEETVDVTEFYSDLETRLQIAEETRDRLYALLERTEDVEERIKILQEIRRLSEEIERINLTFEMLKELISFSRITVRLVSRLEYERAADNAVPFPWIDDLHPLYPVAERFEGSVKGELPDMFAVFKKDKYFHAETADGVRLRIATVPNRPRGDGNFWQEALAYHLSPRFAQVTPEATGELSGVLLKSKDSKPYYYFVGVKTDKKKLHILELFIPDEQLLEAHYSSVVEALEEFEIR